MPMNPSACLAAGLFVAAVASLPAQSPDVQRLVFPEPAPDGMRYAISVPPGYDASNPRPLVLALHPGGGRTPYYGEGFMRQIAEPALRSWDALQGRSHPVWFTELRGIGHFTMGGYVDPLRAAGDWILEQWGGVAR
jgi:hypothetical protein